MTNLKRKPALSPKVQHGYSFNGQRETRVTFDLNAPNLDEQFAKVFGDGGSAG